jgi:hypothetical protein
VRAVSVGGAQKHLSLSVTLSTARLGADHLRYLFRGGDRGPDCANDN